MSLNNLNYLLKNNNNNNNNNLNSIGEFKVLYLGIKVQIQYLGAIV